MQMVCGTPVYMGQSPSVSAHVSHCCLAAPEVILDRGEYSPLCDIWSIGVIMYQA